MAESNDENAKKKEIKERKEEFRELSDVYKRRALGEPHKKSEPKEEKIEIPPLPSPAREIPKAGLSVEQAMSMYSELLQRAEDLAKTLKKDLESTHFEPENILIEHTESGDIRYGVENFYGGRRGGVLKVPEPIKEVLYGKKPG